MRKSILLCIILICAATAFATALCTDTDGGGASHGDAALKAKGKMKYGISTHDDICLTSKDGVSTNSSAWLKEYYCDTSDQGHDVVYDCTRYGFTGCQDGACVGSASGTTTANGSSSSSSQTANQPHCGNKLIEKDKGETCDPPGHICFGKTSLQYGSCGTDCQCVFAKSAEKAPIVCGDGDRDTTEECEVDKDCPANFVCSSCKCVKELTPAEIEAMKNQAAGHKDTTTTTESLPTETPKTTLPSVDTTPKNFSDTAGMKATSGITGFFKGIFSWIASLFA